MRCATPGGRTGLTTFHVGLGFRRVSRGRLSRVASCLDGLRSLNKQRNRRTNALGATMGAGAGMTTFAGSASAQGFAACGFESRPASTASARGTAACTVRPAEAVEEGRNSAPPAADPCEEVAPVNVAIPTLPPSRDACSPAIFSQPTLCPACWTTFLALTKVSVTRLSLSQ